MKLFYIPILMFFLLLSFHERAAYATEVIGIGWGETEVAAKREALLDISSRISVTVRSKFKSVQAVNSLSVNNKLSETVNLTTEITTETSSELPILGADFTFKKIGSQISAEAKLETIKNLPLYERRMGQLRNRITTLNKSLEKAQTGESKYSTITSIFTLLDEFNKLNIVTSYLGGTQQDPGVSEDTLQNQLRTVTKQVDNLDLAAKLLLEGINESGIYIFPAKSRNSNEITAFGALIKDKLSTQLKSIQNPSEADFTLIGQYEESENGLDITYRLIDGSSVAQKTNSVRVLKEAYRGVETKPKSLDFDQLLKSGVALSGNLRVNISSNFGSHDLLFHGNDEVEFFVKLSESGYFYVLGHSLKANENNSYMLELHESEGARKFVYFVNADDANKWISIGKFNVIAPFGVEGLQVFASNKDLVDNLPPIKLDSDSGLYLVSANPKEGILKTRAIVKKFSKTALMSEASLMFTSKEK